MRRAAAAVAQYELVLLALATAFFLIPGMRSLLGLALIGVT
jgi:hypothetical protein